jgi:hypothetical protein
MHLGRYVSITATALRFITSHVKVSFFIYINRILLQIALKKIHICINYFHYLVVVSSQKHGVIKKNGC